MEPWLDGAFWQHKLDAVTTVGTSIDLRARCSEDLWEVWFPRCLVGQTGRAWACELPLHSRAKVVSALPKKQRHESVTLGVPESKLTAFQLLLLGSWGAHCKISSTPNQKDTHHVHVFKFCICWLSNAVLLWLSPSSSRSKTSSTTKKLQSKVVFYRRP